MHPNKFVALVHSTFATILRLQEVKGGEYAPGADRLANFKEAAKRTGMTPEQVLLVYLDKHYASISNYIKDKASGVVRPLSEPIDGRLDDIITYCLLAKALFGESSVDLTAVQAAMIEPLSGLQWDDTEG